MVEPNVSLAPALKDYIGTKEKFSEMSKLLARQLRSGGRELQLPAEVHGRHL